MTGCTPVSAGCRECYARAIYTRFGRDFSKVATHPDKLARLRRKRFSMDGNKRGPHSRPICFVCDTGDLFHEEVPDEFIIEALDMMVTREEVTWLVLTKRARRLHEITNETALWLNDSAHIWFGISAENQKAFNDRWSWLDNAAVETRWISAEPMLGPINLYDARPDWVVCGGESGPNRRPFDLDWAKDLKRQCDGLGKPWFGKQGSGRYPGTRLAIDGREWKEWPR